MVENGNYLKNNIKGVINSNCSSVPILTPLHLDI